MKTCCALQLISSVLVIVLYPALYTCAASRTTETASVDLIDGLSQRVYWSDDVEREGETLFTEEQRNTFARKARSQRVVKLQIGCGRMKNRLATLEDGTKVCCRYRDNPNELSGDLYSYYFNNLLGIWNIPPTTVVHVDFASEQWRSVVDAAKVADWEDDSDVIMIQYIEGLTGEHIPNLLKKETAVLSQSSVHNLTVNEQVRLMQWTDMIVFDFIIGHTDRLFNTLLNAQWNSHMMEKPVHNLEKNQDGRLVLIDNELGFWLGYTIAASNKPQNYDFQVAFLNRICIFRKSTVQNIFQLHQSQHSDAVLEQYMQSVDLKSYESVRRMNTKNRQEFMVRLGKVLDRVQQCSLKLLTPTVT